MPAKLFSPKFESWADSKQSSLTKNIDTHLKDIEYNCLPLAGKICMDVDT